MPQLTTHSVMNPITMFDYLEKAGKLWTEKHATNSNGNNIHTQGQKSTKLQLHCIGTHGKTVSHYYMTSQYHHHEALCTHSTFE